jgi:hypothetical protein
MAKLAKTKYIEFHAKNLANGRIPEEYRVYYNFNGLTLYRVDKSVLEKEFDYELSIGNTDLFSAFLTPADLDYINEAVYDCYGDLEEI